SGSTSENSGEMPHHLRQRMRTRAWVLRELRTSAMHVILRTGLVETRSRLRTARFDAIERPGRTTKSCIRAYSMAGIMAMSAALVRRASAHCEGTVKESWYLPRKGPCVKPRTSGAVFRY